MTESAGLSDIIVGLVDSVPDVRMKWEWTKAFSYIFLRKWERVNTRANDRKTKFTCNVIIYSIRAALREGCDKVQA